MSAWAENIAVLPSTVVTFSSQNLPNQAAVKAVDGVVDGYPGDVTREWAATNNGFPSAAGGTDAWIRLDWPVGYEVTQVTLWDRPNNSDWVQGGTLSFSDGSSVAVGSLPNNASSPLVVNFAARVVTWVRFDVDNIGPNTNNVGLSEIAVEGTVAANAAPTADAGPNQTVVEGSLVQLNGNGSSDPNGDPLTYSWTQPGGTPVTLSSTTVAAPTFTAPTGLSGNENLTFNLQVSDGALTDTDTVVITVTPAGTESNIALLPSTIVTFSSQNLPNQAAVKAVDGVVDGYPGDVTREWAATNNGSPTPEGGTDAWIQLAWPTAYLVDEVRLWDRPNFSDWVQGGTLRFSDGSSVGVGALPNTATSPGTLNFSARSVTWVRFEVDAIGPNTNNVGLSEFEVIGVPAGNLPPNADAGPNQTVVEGSVVQLNGTGSSDPNGDPLSFAWNQTGGTTVSLSSTTVASPTFTAPNGLSGNEVLTFNLQVDDGEESANDTVVITVTPAAANQPPVANAGPDQVVNQGVSVQLDASASSDPESNPLSFTWSQTGGTSVSLSNTGVVNPTFTAPSGLSSNEVLTFNVNVSDGNSSTDDSVQVTVLAQQTESNIALLPSTIVTFSTQNLPNQAAIKAVDGVVDGYPGDVTREWAATNNGSPTPEGGTDAWIQLAWPVAYLIDEVRLWDRPNFSDWVQGGTLRFSDGSSVGVGALPNTATSPGTLNFSARSVTWVRFEVDAIGPNTNNVGLSEFEVIGVPAGNLPPIANAGPDQTVEEGTLVQLNGSGSSDPNGDPLTFAWSQTGGTTVSLSSTSVASPTFTAPTGLSSNEILTFNLQVGDGALTANDTVVITVTPEPANQPPVANAGPDQGVEEGENVQLNATGSSDPDGDPLTYNWSQTSGTTVSLSSTSSATPTFVAPSNGAENLIFQVTVDDGEDNDTDSVTISVSPAGSGPTANAGADQAARQGVLVGLTAAGSSGTGPLTYSWSQTGGTPVTLSNTSVVNPTFTSPGNATTLTFSVNVGNGSGNDSDQVDVIILADPVAENIALLPSVAVTASSENLPNQAAIKAVDGVVDGYPGDVTREWAATNNGFPSGAGGTDAWIRLDWPTTYVVSQVVLHDRPNFSDWVTGGLLTFSDGSTVNVGTLPNNSAAAVINFTPRQVRWVRFDVDAIGPNTNNVGLSEFEVFGTPGCLNYPSVNIISPEASHFQTSSTLNVETDVCLDSTLHSTWGVRIFVAGGPETIVTNTPYNGTLTGLGKAEHTVQAQIIDGGQNDHPGLFNLDQVSNVGRGDYYVAFGDSITFGVGDDIASDDLSNDGRNNSRGFTPLLNNLLSASLNYPNFVANEGGPGDTASEGLAKLAAAIANHPDADAFLIKFGVNDSFPFMPIPSGAGLNPGDAGYPGTFKDSMQQIVNQLNAANLGIYIAKPNVTLGDLDQGTQYPPPVQTAARNQLILEYIDAINEIIAVPANNVSPNSPDFFNEFLNNQLYQTEYSDNFHPNGAGYQTMGDLWFQAITAP